LKGEGTKPYHINGLKNNNLDKKYKKPHLQTDAELMDQVLGATRPLTRPAASKRIPPEEHVEDVHRRVEAAAAAPGTALFNRLFAGLEKTRFFLNPAQ
jgi:hypothetical protein